VLKTGGRARPRLRLVLLLLPNFAFRSYLVVQRSTLSFVHALKGDGADANSKDGKHNGAVQCARRVVCTL
jgi:hypothetical protein